VHAGNLESSLQVDSMRSLGESRPFAMLVVGMTLERRLCEQMINQTLRHFGLPAPTVLPCDNVSDAAFTANILYLLLQHRTQADQRMKEAEENLKRCQFDLNVARNNQGRLKDLLQARFRSNVSRSNLHPSGCLISVFVSAEKRRGVQVARAEVAGRDEREQEGKSPPCGGER